MKNPIRNILIIFIIIIVAILIFILGIILINVVNDYKPENRTVFIPSPTKPFLLTDSLTFSVISWNIGYGGLGKDMDFFYDGGESVKPERDQYQTYFAGILQNIEALDSVDFLLLQEVDTSSQRSYYENQYKQISQKLSACSALFVKNYDVAFVPMPPQQPMGQVVSGLAAFSKYGFSSAEQIVLPGNYSWPTSLFMLDRCFLVTAIALNNAKNLFIINTHLSAFDDGNLREGQLIAMQKYMQEIYDNGNYVIATGDWNINPPSYTNSPFSSGDISFLESPSMDFNWFGEEWNIVYDPEFPTNRKVDKPYINGISQTTILDYFICSPNITILNSKTLYNAFQFTDHHPVYLRFKLK